MTTTDRRLAVVVLNWHAHERTLHCVTSLQEHLLDADRVFVVDNGSNAADLEALSQGLAGHTTIQILCNPNNLGFAGGTNTGVRAAIEEGYTWILWLNNDTVLGKDAIARLLQDAERLGADAAQPELILADGVHIDSRGLVPHRSLGISDLDRTANWSDTDSRGEPVEIFGPCGAAALFRTSSLRRAGLMDDALFTLCEDGDQAFRIRAAGGRAYRIPRAIVYHERGISHGDDSPRDLRRRRKFWLQRNTVALALRYWPTHLLLQHLPRLTWRAAQALWLSRSFTEFRCLGLWRRAWMDRPGFRRRMVDANADRWFR